MGIEWQLESMSNGGNQTIIHADMMAELEAFKLLHCPLLIGRGRIFRTKLI